ncbi:tetratricopeptide repeat protein [Roseofilum casamattae]|uniref:Tetratricopeptide repeat protein n=1 Tax=Roseofilum casamattae BLCC-M143 TaxID=3022442 RepID=A0ABT7BYM7_9CYAN|nr:tetratricopeptide repeat protein [Roseofilum casamattae]MDJ1183383.1 tetratricopeptide repeat protein [Roseofilum casamattae BLCC-M143]
MVRLRDSRGQLHNHDLAGAVGCAIALIIKARAEARTYPGSTQKLVSLAEYTISHWRDIAEALETGKNEQFAPIEDSRVPELFSQALGGEAVSVLEKGDWLLLLQEMQQSAEISLPQNVVNELAENLRDKFIFALREVLKADFAGDGKAFASLVISLLGSLHAQLARVAGGTTTELPEANIEELNQAVEKLASVRQELEQNRSQFQQLGASMASGMEQILSEFQITRAQTEALVQSLQFWLRGELEEVKDVVREMGATLKEGQAEITAQIDSLREQLAEINQVQSQPTSGATSSFLGDRAPSITHWQGREKALQKVNGWLDNRNCKVSIILGVGGVGKSALASKIYAERQDFTSNYWADLSGAPELNSLARNILHKWVLLSEQEANDIPENQVMPYLMHQLQEQRYLLVLDNFESVSAKLEYRDFLQDLLSNCHHQSEILVTTQVPVKPELHWLETPQVLPLSGLSPVEGAQLLHSRKVKEEQAKLEAFSENVSGHPLTLTLVAGVLTNQEDEDEENRLTLAELTENINLVMDDPRIAGPHRRETVSLLVVLQRCFQRLAPVWQERLLLLAVLRQGFTRELVSQMVAAEVTRKDLSNLVKRGFLVALEQESDRPQRYEFLPLILTYLQHRAGDLTPAHQQAVAVYRDRCQMPEDLKTATVEDVQDYLEAFYHLCQLGEYEQAFDVLYNPENYRHSASKFLERRGYNFLLVELYLQLVQHLPNRQNWRYTASLTSLGIAYYSLGEYQKAIDYHQQSLQICEEIGDLSGIAASLNNLGSAYDSLGEYQKAIDYYQQSLDIFREIGDRSGIAASFNNLGSAYDSLGEYQEAIDYYQQSLQIQQEIGDRSGIAKSLGNLGNAYDSLGEYQQAIDYYQQSLDIFRAIGNQPLENKCLRLLIASRSRLEESQKTVELQGWETLFPGIKSIIRFARKNKLNLVLCSLAGVFAFPFALIWIIAILLYRLIRRTIR